MQRPPALGRVLLDLGCRGGRGVAGRGRELLAQSLERDLLVLARRLEGLCVLAEPRVDLVEETLLALAQPEELLGERLLRALEVARPRRDALVDPRLRSRQRLGELRRRLPLPLRDERATLLRMAALLLRQQRDRVGARAGEHVRELVRAGGDLALHDLVEDALCALDLGLERGEPGERPPQRTERERQADEREAGDEGDRDPGHVCIVRVTRAGAPAALLRARRPRPSARAARAPARVRASPV